MKLTLLIALLSTPAVLAQMATHDAGTQATIAQGNADQLTKWTESISKLNTQIEKMNQVVQQGQQILNIAGDPASALGAIGGLGGLNTSLDTEGLSKLGSELSKTADGLQSLQSTGEGLYKSIPSSLPDGTSITRDVDGYKKFGAVEENFKNFTQTSKDIDSRLKTLRSELKATANKAATTEAMQREKQAKLQAINSEIAALEAQRKAAADQLAAQQIANENDKEKQAKAAGEEGYQDAQRARKNWKMPKR